MDLLSLFPMIFGVIFIAVVILFFILVIVRRFGPVGPGIPRGNYQIVIRDDDNNIILDTSSQLVETSKFLNRSNVSSVKAFLASVNKGKIAVLKRNETENTVEIKKLEDSLKKLDGLSQEDLLKFGRVYVIRDGMQKCLILQKRYTEKPLSEYAAKKSKAKLSLSFGFIVSGLLEGKGKLMLRETQNFPEYGKCLLYTLEPLSGSVGTEKPVDYEPWFSDLMVNVPTLVQMEELVKSKDVYIVNLEKRLSKSGFVASGAKTETDFHRDTMALFGRTDDPKRAGKLDMLDYACISVPTIIFSVIGMTVTSGSLGPFAGTIVGLFIGLGLVGFMSRGKHR